MHGPGRTWTRGWLAAALAATLLAAAAGAGAQPGADAQGLRDELRALREAVEGLKTEVQEMRTLLRQQRALAQPSLHDLLLHVGDHRVKGERAARITIVEFSDFECAFCGKFARETLPQLDRDYIATGKVRYAFRHFPLEALHPNALAAAAAAGCAEEQGKFWPMHDRLFADQQGLGEPALRAHAAALALDAAAFEACVASGRQRAEARRDIEQGTRARVRGTPTFFLGYTDPGSRELKPVDVIIGAQPYLAFKMALERLLDRKP
jgi:protein-disulfide isomerase